LTPSPNQPSQERARDVAATLDAETLVARLTELAPSLTPAQRQSATERLQRAGLAASAPGASGLPSAPVDEIQRLLSHGSRDQLDAARALAMAAALADVAIRLDAVMTDLWRRLSPNSSVKKTPSVRMTLSRFAAGDAETDRAAVDAELTLLQKVTVSLASAIKPAAGRFARRHLEMYGSEAVEEAERDAAGRGMGFEARCWKRYQQMCADMDVEAYERELLQLVAEEADRLMRGRT
jgi:hypothetical protein